VAHLWDHALPVARRLPGHACGAHDAAAAAEELLSEEPGARRPTELLVDADAGGGEEAGDM